MCEALGDMSHARTGTHAQTHTHSVRTPTQPHMHTSQVHRLTALSKKCFTDGSFPFFLRLTDLSTKLRWCPICLCTFKIHTHRDTHINTHMHAHTQPHTHLLLTQVDTCSRNKLNQMSALQISFLIPLAPSLSLTTSRPLLLFFHVSSLVL